MKIELDIGYPSNLLYSNVSISIPDHGILSFLGENGSGKSTLFKTLTGMIKPMKGQVSSEFMNIPWWRSHLIHENRATQSI